MSRYIDADKTLRRFKELNCRNANWIAQLIEWQPTADVQEVKHGRWIRKKPHLAAVWCSECDHTFEGDSRYCPNCGARMRLEDDNGR